MALELENASVLIRLITDRSTFSSASKRSGTKARAASVRKRTLAADIIRGYLIILVEGTGLHDLCNTLGRAGTQHVLETEYRRSEPDPLLRPVDHRKGLYYQDCGNLDTVRTQQVFIYQE